jgi:hypothetical protein
MSAFLLILTSKCSLRGYYLSEITLFFIFYEKKYFQYDFIYFLITKIINLLQYKLNTFLPIISDYISHWSISSDLIFYSRILNTTKKNIYKVGYLMQMYIYFLIWFTRSWKWGCYFSDFFFLIAVLHFRIKSTLLFHKQKNLHPYPF